MMPWELGLMIGVLLVCLGAGILSYRADRKVRDKKRTAMKMYKHLQLEDMKRVRHLK